MAEPRKKFDPRSLDAINFLLSDVRGAMGPYLNVFLVTDRHWSQSEVGLVTTTAGILGLLVQTPVGAAIDATHRKRAMIAAALAVLAVGAIVFFTLPYFWPVLFANSLMAAAGDVFGPAVAALTLGLYTKRQLARRMGRNAAWDHAGNVVIALIAAGVGYWFGQRAVFLLVPFFCVLTTFAVYTIPGEEVDYNKARYMPRAKKGDEKPPVAVTWRSLVHSRALMVFAGASLLFQLANVTMLPLAGQKLALSYPDWATAMVSICVIVAQAVMLPVALAVGRTADDWGRKKLLIIGFAVLPLRAILFAITDNSYLLIAEQLLDGVSAGIFGAITPLVIADIMRDTGRYNLAQGLVATLAAIGAAASGILVGLIVDHMGYAAGFLFMGAVAAAAFLLILFAMPETADGEEELEIVPEDQATADQQAAPNPA